MKAKEVYKLLKDRFSGKTIHLKVQFGYYAHDQHTEMSFDIFVHGINPKDTSSGAKLLFESGSSWQEAYNKFNSTFAEIAITALNEKHKEQF